MADGLKISEAVDVVLEQRGSDARSGPPAIPATPRQAFEPLVDELLDALSRFNRPEAEAIVGRLVGTSSEQLIDLLYFPLLRGVGEAWAEGNLSVAQEHFASAFVRDQLIGMLLLVGCGPPHGTHVACVTFPEEQHELGVLGVGRATRTLGLPRHLPRRRSPGGRALSVRARPPTRVGMRLGDHRDAP